METPISGPADVAGSARGPRGGSARLGALDELRGIALLWVIGGHALLRGFGGGLWQSFADPTYGVSLFFAISGALVGGSLLGASGEPGALRRFAIRRGARLLLPHLVAMAAYLALLGSLAHPEWVTAADFSGDPAHLLWSAALLFALVPAAGSANHVVPGNWSISAEWLAALVLVPLLVRFARSERRALGVALGLAALGGAASVVLGSIRPHYLFWGPLHAGSFAAGWWALLRSRRADRLGRGERLAIGAIASLLGASALLAPSPQLAGLIGGLLVRRILRAGRPSGGSLGRACAWLGTRSYGGYLGHFLGLGAAAALVAGSQIEPALAAALSAGLGLAAAVIVAGPFFRFVENPAIRLGRRGAARLGPGVASRA